MWHMPALELRTKWKALSMSLVKIADAFKMSQCLVFCRTNVDCDNLEAYLHRLDGSKKSWGGKMESGKENPYSCVVLAGARNQRERQGNLEAFKEGDVLMHPLRGALLTFLGFSCSNLLSANQQEACPIQKEMWYCPHSSKAEEKTSEIAPQTVLNGKVFFHKTYGLGPLGPRPESTHLWV